MSERRRRGRPARVPGHKADVRVELRLTHAEHADLERVARDNGVSVAMVLREAVNDYVADYDERSPIFVR